MTSFKNICRITILACCLTLLLAAAAFAKPQDTCPVLGNKLTNKNTYVDYEGKRIYFCCPGCDAKFKADPEKYIKEMEEQGVEFDKAPAPKE
ncbi:YHS domain-containing protein [Oceanidesulfovibrio marinus]|uniref:YHS domain-containing protein n=1 Tax=Oceanidesulfovibrio marinus TaxID=370038 RepID=A0A6P1ZDN8_9BACT|nr:YHS domain-containing protein [Oceanidesulfovibrio marinus]QJT10803.1 YHS domain-containing protein [Oceanidesulfovibrio marinus]TVM31893.1 hypothetical protein DQK91_16950 [Oceanidesulfovibrio marinus]